jgi:hypothetical protein
MLRRRKMLLALVVCLLGGSFYGTLGYALYLRSGLYRRQHERKLEAFLDLPAAIGSVKAQSYRRIDFLNIGVWLPERRVKIFDCRVAEWHELVGDGGGFALVLRDGRLMIDSSQWQQGDYGLVLKSGLAHDFTALRLRRVDLYDVDLVWRAHGVGLTVRRASGRVHFSQPDEGTITVISRMLNETATDEPIHVFARFRPSRDLVVHEVVLRAPPLPVRALGLESVLGVPEARGTFEGRLRYHEDRGRPRVQLDGRARDIDLSDWTARLTRGPLHGRINTTIEMADLTESNVVSARFNGKIEGLRLGDLTRLAGVPPIEGTAEVELLNAELADNTLIRAVVRGKATAQTLEPITALLGPGRMNGTLRILVNSLELADERVIAADVDLEVVPPKDAPATLDTELVLGAARTLFGIELQPIIAVPLQRLKTVAYSKLACKLLVEGNQLRVLGTHGPGGKSILTVRMFGTDLAVLSQPDKPMELAPLIAKLRRGGEQKLRELIEQYRPGATTMPSSTGPTAPPREPGR